eukprot:Colp12_sorted_trinity150504_noHs@3062
MDAFKRLIPGDQPEEEEQGIMSEFNDQCSLSKTQRLYGFGICFVVGLLMSIMATVAFAFGNLTGFAVLYTLGNVTSLASACFVAGPWSHVKSMFDSKRWIATAVMLISIVLVLVSALALKLVALTIIFVIIEFAAMFWYTLSYIPFGRDMFVNCFKGACGNIL